MLSVVAGLAAQTSLGAAFAGIQISFSDAIRVGEPMLVLEAMKMENEIKAATDGVIEKIFVTEGATVETGTMLVRIA